MSQQFASAVASLSGVDGLVHHLSESRWLVHQQLADVGRGLPLGQPHHHRVDVDHGAERDDDQATRQQAERTVAAVEQQSWRGGRGGIDVTEVADDRQTCDPQQDQEPALKSSGGRRLRAVSE